MLKNKVVVRVGDRFLEFKCHIHEVVAPEGLLIEPALYTKFGTLPSGRHFELEIFDERVWTHKHKKMIHWHRSKLNGRHFVCYPLPVTTKLEATRVFALWAVGTAFTMTNGVDFGNFFDGRHHVKFFNIMARNYHIQVSSAFLSGK